jgi:hypothetical protein
MTGGVDELHIQEPGGWLLFVRIEAADGSGRREWR